MNKLLTKIVGAIAGLAMVIGVGFTVANNREINRVDAVTVGDTFSRISAVNQLSDGDEIIFVNQAETYACGTTQNTNNRVPVAITTSNHTYEYSSADNVQIFVVKINNSNYGFHTGNGYIYSASSSSNYLKTNTTAASTAPSGTSAWGLTVSNYVFTISNKSNTSYYLAFNGTSYFSQYKSGQSKPYIYKKTAAAKTLTGISVQTAPTKTTYAVGEFFDPTGLVITRSYDDSSSDTYTYAGHASDFTFSPNLTTPLAAENASVSITYANKTTTQSILVRTVTGVELLGDMSNKSYIVGEEWDLTGLYISITWSGGEPNPTTKNISELTKDSDYLLDKETASLGDTTLYVYGEHLGCEFNKTITGIVVDEKPIEDLLRTASTSLNITSGSYTDFSGITNAKADINSGVTWAGTALRNKDKDYSLQLNGTTRGVYTTASAGQFVKSVAVDFYDDNGKELYFYGSNKAYTAINSSIDEDTNSTLIATLDKDTTSANISGNYKYVYFYSSGAIYMNSVTVAWKLAKTQIAENIKTKASLAYSDYTDNGNGTFGYDNLAIRFTGYIEENLWDRLDDESGANGYGILLSTTDYLNGQVDKELKNYYATADGSNVKKFDNTDTVHDPALKPTPTLKDGYYVWNLFKRVALDDATKNYVALAYIKLTSGQVLFLDGIETSVKKLAQDLIAGPDRDENSLGGSLNYLANL